MTKELVDDRWVRQQETAQSRTMSEAGPDNDRAIHSIPGPHVPDMCLFHSNSPETMSYRRSLHHDRSSTG